MARMTRDTTVYLTFTVTREVQIEASAFDLAHAMDVSIAQLRRIVAGEEDYEPSKDSAIDALCTMGTVSESDFSVGDIEADED